MNKSESIAALSAALVKAQAENDRHAERRALQQMLPSRISSGRGHARRPVAERLLERVRFGATDCWHWCGVTNTFGYGRFSVGGITQVAHRVSYKTFVGAIPDGMSVLHRCDNPSCINPEHLWIGTRSDNMLDCWAKGRTQGRRGKQ